MTSWKNVTPDEFTINGLLKCSWQTLEKEIFVCDWKPSPGGSVEMDVL